MAAAPVTKIYDLRTTGFEAVHKDLQQLTKDFEAVKKAKLEAEKAVAGAQGTTEAAKYREELHKIRLEEAELKKQRQQMINDAKAQTLAQQAQVAEEKQRAKAAQESVGWYFELTKQIRELSRAVKSVQTKGDQVLFRGETLQFDQAIAKLQQLTGAEQEFRRQFAKDRTLVGEYTTGIVQAFKQMGLDDLIMGQVTRTQKALNGLNADFDRLQKELQETKAAGLGTETIERQMIENRNEVIKLDTELVRLRTDLRGTGDVGNQISTSLNKGFQAVKGQLSGLLIQYLSVQALIQQAIANINEAKISSDQFTDLQIQLGGSAEEAQKLNDQLKALNTRTTLTGLQQIADVALKAGVTADNIASVTEAIDKTKVAFGKDFGSVEEGTETFAKLINIFFDDGQITGDRILKIGNAIRTLANETVASVPFITDFSGRMAGLRQIANVSLPDILGLGAGFEQFKQSAEVSSTVLVKVIPKIAQDVGKFAQIVGVTTEEFQKLIDTNPAEALIQVSEALLKNGGDLQKIQGILGDVNQTSDQIADNLTKAAGSSITEVSKALGDAELGSGRITTILATIGGKADVFRERIRRAGETIQDTTAITDAFEKKNNNLAASIDKLTKRLRDAASTREFQIALSIIVGAITLVITNLPILLGLLTLLAISWGVQSASLIALRAQVIFYNAAIGATSVLIGILRIANLAYIVTMGALNIIIGVVTRTLALFNITAKITSGPLGVILAIAGLLVGAFQAFGKSVKGSTSALEAHNAQLKLERDIAREAQRAVGERIAQTRLLIGVVKDLSISEETRMATLKKLIEIDQVFNKALVDGKINYEKLNEALTEYNKNLIRSAELEALKARATRATNNLIDLQIKKQDIETAISTKNFDDLEEKSRELVVDQVIRNQGKSIFGRFAPPTEKDFIKASRQVVKALDEAAVEQEAAIKNIENVYKEKTQGLIDLNAETQQKLAESTPKVVPFQIDIPKLKKEIEALQKEIDEFQGVQKDLDVKTKLLKKKQEELAKALGQDKVGTRGSRLTGAQKDAQKEIDALRDEELARLNEALALRKNFIRREQEIIRVGEDGKIQISREALSIRITDEEVFLREQFLINKRAIDDKLALLKGETAEERKIIAELKLERTRQEQQTNEKIFEIRAKAIKQRLDNAVAAAKLEAERIEKDPTASETAKLEAKLKADQDILNAQIAFNNEMDKLEKERNFVSKENVERRELERRQQEQNVLTDVVAIERAKIAEIRTSGENQQREFEINFIKLRRAILDNDRLTASQRKRALERLAALEKFTILSGELAQLTLEFDKIAALYKKGLATEKEFLDAKAAMERKAEDQSAARKDLKNKQLVAPSVTDLQGALTEQLNRAFGFDENSEEARVLGNVIADAYNIATEAMSNFFNAEEEAIKNNLDLQLERIETDKKRAQAKAQSDAEIESLEKQAEAKKQAATRKANEDLKKVRRSEAKLAFAVELANIAVQASQYPFPASLIIGGVLTGLAFARYAARVAEINSAKFEKGGLVGKKKGRFQRAVDAVRTFARREAFTESSRDVPLQGGKFRGQPHERGGTKFKFKGREFEAEVDELAVIRTKSAPRNKKFKVEGTQMEIASAINRIGGGEDFKPGAKIRRFADGGIVGGKLQPPVMQAPNLVNAISPVDMDKMLEKLDQVVETNQQNVREQSARIDRLQVSILEREMTQAQRKREKQTNIGTL